MEPKQENKIKEEEEKEEEEKEEEEKEKEEKEEEEKEEEEKEEEEKEEEGLEMMKDDNIYEDNEYEENENDDNVKIEYEDEEDEYEENEDNDEITEVIIEENEFEEDEYEENVECECIIIKEEEEEKNPEEQIYDVYLEEFPKCLTEKKVTIKFKAEKALTEPSDSIFELNLKKIELDSINEKQINCPIHKENKNYYLNCTLSRDNNEIIQYNISHFTNKSINITNLNNSQHYIRFMNNIEFAEIQEKEQIIDDSNFYFYIILKNEISSVPKFALLKNGENILGDPTCVINNNKIVQCSFEALELLKKNNGNYQVYYFNPCNNKINMDITVKVTTQNTHKKFGSGKFIKSIFINLVLILIFMF